MVDWIKSQKKGSWAFEKRPDCEICRKDFSDKIPTGLETGLISMRAPFAIIR